MDNVTYSDNPKYSIEVKKIFKFLWEWNVIYCSSSGKYAYPRVVGYRFSERKAWERAKISMAKYV